MSTRRNDTASSQCLTLMQPVVLVEGRLQLMVGRRRSEALQRAPLIQGLMTGCAQTAVLMNHAIVNHALLDSVMLQPWLREMGRRNRMHHISLEPLMLDTPEMLGSANALGTAEVLGAA